jgi:PhnB protein
MENDNRNTISISAESREEADKLFNSLSAIGKVEMPIADGPWVYTLECFQINSVFSGW